MSRKAKRKPMTKEEAQAVYAIVDDLDLPDGAHWAMFEELTGMDAGEYAELMIGGDQ